MKILVTGATGFLGRAFTTEAQQQGHSFVILSRRPGSAEHPQGAQVFAWSDDSIPGLPQFDVAVHLAGEPISQFWNEAKKNKILHSRKEGTRLLVDALGSMSSAARPRVLVSASAVGYYGNRGEEVLTEDSAAGSGFLADVCSAWENEAVRAERYGIRVVRVRTGIVLGPDGGALQRFLPIFKLGLGGPFGSGRQWFPWIHLDDMAGIIMHAITNDSLSGPINAVAPGIVRNYDFTRALATALHRPAFIPAPVPALWLIVGEFARHLVESQHVLPNALQQSGYKFRYPQLSDALQDILE
jgi:uncharacterized protein (TIGR01777 family)